MIMKLNSLIEFDSWHVTGDAACLGRLGASYLFFVIFLVALDAVADVVRFTALPDRRVRIMARRAS
jgi:hypothetical protein